MVILLIHLKKQKQLKKLLTMEEKRKTTFLKLRRTVLGRLRLKMHHRFSMEKIYFLHIRLQDCDKSQYDYIVRLMRKGYKIQLLKQ